jgi:hypothetical protein
MTIRVLDLYEMKPEFIPADLRSQSVHVEPGTLAMLFDADQWRFVGRNFHPNGLQAREVMRHGYCVRKAPSRLRFSALLHRAEIIRYRIELLRIQRKSG